MKLNKRISSLLLISLLSCNDFEALNINPNEPTSISTGVLFSSALRKSVQTTSNEAFLLSNNIAQLTAKTLRAEVDFYNWNAFPTVWEGLYESLADLKEVVRVGTEEGNLQAVGAAKVLQTWIFSQLTNAYGDIPYSEAINGDQSLFTPKYDQQVDIYKGMMAELDVAISALNGSGTISGDILYNGQANHWKKFANGLKLRLLMYASAQQDVAAEFAEVVSGGELFTSNEEQASLTFLSAFPNQFPTRPLKQGDFDAVAISKSAVTALQKTQDPRLSRYARPDNENFDTPIFTGVENGVGGQTGSRLGLAYYDYPGQITASEKGLQTAEGILMTYAEIEFLLAEGVLKGWIQGDVAAHYKKGIRASHDYYQVSYTPFGWQDFSDFYENSSVAYTTPMDVWEQKWLSLYFSALDPYFEVRRWYTTVGGWDGLPFLNAPIGNNFNNYELPMRFLYPGQEQSLNEDNYKQANANYNTATLINGKMWIVSD